MQNPKGLRPYQTVAGAGESEIVISKSRFLGFCLPVTSEAEAQERISELKKRFWDARHCCYAFRLSEGGISRSSDDGEPSGTAGAPILNVLIQNSVENTLIAVVRYFGGVLLGTGGLVRAYGKTASEALSAAGILPMRVCERVSLIVSYASYAALEPVLRTGGYTVEPEFGEQVTLTCVLPAEDVEAFLKTVTERTDGGAQIARGEQLLQAYGRNINQPNGTAK
ncbi:MAG: YigZ family protein [Christensenella sp.]|nr:YigZ family protein [Christensenella sp.]